MQENLEGEIAGGSGSSVSRREFIGSAALTSAGVAAGLSYYFSRPEPPDLSRQKSHPVRMGFIGVGNRGGSLLRTALQVPGAHPVAVCDKLPQKLKDQETTILKVMAGPESREQLSAYEVHLYDDYRRLLDRKDVEAVVIATPHYLHGMMALDAVQAGKHVYCEKAMAFTIGENQDIYSLVKSGAKSSGGKELVFQVGHQRHYSPLYGRVVDMVRTDHIGDVTAIRGQWNLNDEIRRPCQSLELERVINWRLYHEYSGGLTTEYATHQIDVANWLLGAHPDSVAGYGGVDWYTDGRDTHDNIHLIFNYKVPVVKRDPFGRVEREKGPNGTERPKFERHDDGSLKMRNVTFDYMSIMTNAFLRASELVMGRYGTISMSLGGGEFWKEKKAREDPNRIAEGTNPRRAHQKKILKSGVTQQTLGHTPGEPIPEDLEPTHWTNFIEPIAGAYDKVETLLAMEGFVECVRLAEDGKPFDDLLKADVEVGMWSAVPALMANIAMRENRTVYWSEFFGGVA